MKKTFTYFAIILLQFSFYSVLAENVYKKISVASCDSLIGANASNPNFVILDVRTHGEWVNNHLEGSINRSTGDSDFDQKLAALPKHKIFLIHCQSGGRSAGAFAKMKTLEFAEVYEMEGGIGRWQTNGFSTTSVHAPKLMLVSYTKNLNNFPESDTINITITNHANDVLKLSAAYFNDVHEISNTFDETVQLEGSDDYTFSIFHTPAYYNDDTTNVTIESNGGNIEINIIFENGVIQSIDSEIPNEFTIYPNPATNVLFVKGISEQSIEEFLIFNMAGQVVLHEKYFSGSNGINISGLRNGVYFIQIKIGNSFISKKIIIQN